MARYSVRETGCPVIKFRAGDYGEQHTNVNFARQEAEEIAAATGHDVILHRIVGAQTHVMSTVRPK